MAKIFILKQYLPEKSNFNHTEMRKIIFGTLLLCLIFSKVSIGQDHEHTKQNPKWDLQLEGMLGFSVGEKFYAVNVGGPSLLLSLNQNLKIGVGAFPSFYVLNGKTGARLGVGPRIDHKRFAFFTPFFHKDTTDEWIWSVGMGYKFHRRN
ncbi:hypothetical protein [Aquiflexum sp.]|uniref:hypothetical protein n=1 Tax=Aquiflexum sp. TaxID=1872584 RepID=UPI003594064E